MMAFPDNKYLGEGRYNLSLSEIVGLYVKIDSKETRDAALASLPSLSKAVVPEVKPKQQVVQNQKQGVSDFMTTQQENIEKAIRRQIEFYFGDLNYPKDKYLQKKCGEHPEGYMTLRDVMSFNKMRKLTKSPEQVIKAIAGCPLVEISADKKMIRKAGVKNPEQEEEGAIAE